ncbi:MAG: T9SS type A sorting domain-containing protein [Bacteroidia bacterium]|nr:T9SS type A sorting domain-containing protein [Bacteroidia bacterium]
MPGYSATLTGVLTSTDITCFSYCDGTATMTVAGGTIPYSYNWSEGSTTSSLTGLCADDYYITVTDDNGCIISDTAAISEPPLLVVSVATTDANCLLANGQAIATPNGGTLPYNYLWDDPLAQTDATASALFAGVYHVTVADAAGCTVVGTAIINNISGPTAAIDTFVNVTCFGACDGYTVVTATGGTLPYSGYVWSDGQTNDTASALCPAAYTVTVVDAVGCAGITSVTITEPAVLIANVTGTDVTCYGSTDGTITANASGGTSPYFYLWNTGCTDVACNVSTGAYYVTATDNNGCTTTDSITINEPAALTSSIVTVNVTCNGLSNGSADLSAGGGTAPYDFTWSNSESTEDISSVLAGNYYVTITDNNTCSLIDTATITEPAQIITLIAGTDVLCNGGNDGSSDLTVTGGIAPYNYLWSEGSITEDIAGLTAGMYYVTVTDVNGCQIGDSVSIFEPVAIITIIAPTDVNCYGLNDGFADLSVSGGTAPYDYIWSTGATTEDINSLIAGTYYITVSDVNNCSISDSVNIVQPDSLYFFGWGTTSVTCNGGNDGIASVVAAGGTGTYSYLWNTIPGQTTSSATGLSAGDYTVTVTDENNCTIEKTITVGQPAALTANIIITDISCYGGSDGSADLTVSGGNAPYIYVWSNNSTSEDLSNVISGIYFVTITDAQGCTLVDTTNIIEPSEIVIIISTVDANCGASDGQATATVSGGTAPYSYLWNDPLVQTTPTAINLSAGSYIVTVTDNNGCTSPDTAVVNNVGDLSASIGSVSDVACFGSCDGYTVVSVTGGTPPYTYLWDDALAQTTDTASNLCQGIYNVTVTDNLSCVDFASAVINEPAALSVSNTYTDITCYGAADGTVTANVLGGTFPYSYLWNMGCTDVACNVSTSATYNVTVTDINGCTANDSITITEPAVLIANVTGTDVTCYGSADGTITANTSGGTSPYFYLWNTGCTDLACNVSAGAYYVTATDNNGCTTTDSITINEPSQIITTVSTTDASCTIPDGTASVSVAGGTSPYSYLWNDPLSQTNDTVTGLLAGTYMVIITDAATCSAIDSAIVNNAAAVTATISSTNDVSCNGDCDGSAMVTVSGGTPPFSYLWDDPSAQTDNAAILLCAATYNVTVTDAAGCSDIASVTIIEPAALSVNYTSSDVSCYGGNDGSINITVSGGTVPYSYFWNTGAVTQNLASLPASEYILTVTDANGCTANDSITITEPPEMIVSVTGTDITCYGAADGTVTANVSGGTFPYSYLWNMGCTDIACNVSAGATYNVTVTDINGCIESGTTNVNEPSAIIINITTTDANCGSSDGEAVATVTGGTAPYGYQWDDPLTQTNDTASGLSAGIYNITVTDAAGCTATGTTMVNNTGGLSISVDSISDVTCNGACDGFVIISITGGTPPYTYVWDDPLSQTTDTANNLCAGTYNVTVTDNIGCIDIISAIITEPSAIVTSIAGTDVSCNSGADGAADLTVTGGSLPYTYLWNSGEITEDLTSISAGLYLVTVTDNNLCNAVDSVTITEPSVLINTMIGTDVSCNSGTDGSVDLNISGGTPPYTYTWNTGETTEDLFNIPAGSYFVTITDFNSCTSTVAITINEPSSTTVIISTVDANCGAADGEATANVAGGTLPYSYLWNDPLAQTTATATGLFAGTYNVTITDGAGCTNVETATVNNAGGLTISISSTTDVSCNGLCDGEAVVTITGGTPPFTYMWDDPGAQTTDTASNLCAGTYNVTVTDNDGCIAFASATINEPPAISVISSVTDVSCNGGNDGAIDITVSDGTAPYLYIWNTGETAEDLLNMQAGSFYPTITDANFCSIVSAPIVIGEPVAITTSVSGIDVSCNSGSDGAVDLTVNGGTIPYVYLWNTGQSTQDLINIGFGLYMVTVTDDNGCTAIAWIVINQPSALSTTISTVDADCGMADGEASVSVSGGTPPYNYLWNTGASTDVLQGVSAGIYFVTVTDSNGCTATSNAVINNIGAPAINIDTLIDAICYGFCDGYAAISASGGTPPYSYDWSTGLSGFPIHPDLCAGTYLLTVTDASGCIAIENIIINQPDSIILTFTTTDDFGSGDGTATVSVSGGTTPYNYLWNDSLVQTTETAVSLAYGWYSVYVTDADNCIATDSVEVHLWVTISELKGTFDVKFYPNPVKELCYIKINSDKNSTAEINITDVIGKTMFNNQYYFYSGENLLTFNMKRHPQGVYFVEISINNKLFTTKLVKSE